MKKFFSALILTAFSFNALALPPVDLEGREFRKELLQSELGSTPATPLAGKRKLYPKADGFYQLDSLGAETKVGSGSGGGVANYMSANPNAEATPLTPWVASGWGSASSGWGAGAVNTATDKIAHFFAPSQGIPAIGDEISFEQISGTIPAPLVTNTTYYVAFADSSDIQIAATKNGAVIDITSVGSGVVKFHWGVPVETRGNSGLNTNVTFLRSTSLPMYDTASFRFAKSAGNSMGDGAYYPLTINDGDLGKTLTLTFEYTVVSGTYVDGNAKAFVYDETNKVRVTQADLVLENHLLKSKTAKITFQPSITSTSYTLWIVSSTPTATAYTLAFDTFQLGTQSLTTGPPVSDWTNYTPIIGGYGTVTGNFAEWRRVGDTLFARGRFFAGTVTATSGTIGLPPGLSYDVAKAFGAGGLYQSRKFGEIFRHTATTQPMPGTNAGPYVLTGAAASLTAVALSQTTSASGNTFDLSNASVIASNGDGLVWELSVPIQGWSSNAVISSDSGLSPTVSSASSGTTSITTSGTVLALTAINDPQSLVVSNSFTLKRNERVKISGQLTTANASVLDDLILSIRVNGTVLRSYLATTGSYTVTVTGSYIYDGKAGDVVTFVGTTGFATRSAVAANSMFIVESYAGSQTITMADQISGSYGGSSSSFTSGSGPQIPLFITKQWDTHGAYNPATGIFTAPAPGRYEFHAHTWSSNVTPTAANNAAQLSYAKNNAGESGTMVHYALTTGIRHVVLDSVYVFEMLPGDTVKPVIENGLGVPLTIINNTGYTYFQWKRLQ